MLKFRPIAPKPPAITSLHAAGPDRTRTSPTMKRRKVSRKPRKITAPLKTKTPTERLITAPPIAWVAVERVTASGHAAAVAAGDEVKRLLEEDAAPCFVSDYADRVTWINAGFRKMVLCGESASASMMVELVTRGMVPVGDWFTCVARVRRGEVVLVVLCDVWRVVEQAGKWAWRLDVATGLGLGLSCV